MCRFPFNQPAGVVGDDWEKEWETKSAEAIAATVRAHLDAGANHVCLQPVGVSGIPRDEWTALALALS